LGERGIHNNGTITIYAAAWRVELNQTLAFRVFDDHTCTSMQPYGQYRVDSALCTYSKLINASFMASYLDGRDSAEELRVAYRINCNQDCSECATYNRTAVDSCIPVGACPHCSSIRRAHALTPARCTRTCIQTTPT
jgi:hypothetical protein